MVTIIYYYYFFESTLLFIIRVVVVFLVYEFQRKFIYNYDLFLVYQDINEETTRAVPEFKLAYYTQKKKIF